nr:hypothetical protein [Pseudonocardia sp. AL041005-10]
MHIIEVVMPSRDCWAAAAAGPCQEMPSSAMRFRASSDAERSSASAVRSAAAASATAVEPGFPITQAYFS